MLEMCCLSSRLYFSVNKKKGGDLSGGFSAGRIVKSAFSTAARKSADNKGPAGCCFNAAPYGTLLKRDGGRPWQLRRPRLSAGGKRQQEAYVMFPDRQQIIKLPFKNNADNSQSSTPAVSPLMRQISLTLNQP